MKIEIKTNDGTVLRTFDVPKIEGITIEESHAMGELLAKNIEESAKEYIAWEAKMLETCTCFWKNKSEDERRILKSHSSECAVWGM